DDVTGCRNQRRDLRAEQEDLAALDQRVAVADAQAAGADCLQLPALQRKPGFVAVFEMVVVARGLVQANGLALPRLARAAFVILVFFVLGHGVSLRALSP